MESYDTEKFYLGTMCNRGHGYGSTGFSLRYRSRPNCVECLRIHSQSPRQKANVKAYRASAAGKVSKLKSTRLPKNIAARSLHQKEMREMIAKELVIMQTGTKQLNHL